MRIFVLSTFTAVTAMTASMLIQAPASAQTPSYLRCRGPFEGRAEARECALHASGPESQFRTVCPLRACRLSTAEQKYVGLPCTSPTPKAEAGNAAPCGPVAYSTADQNYVSRPCTP